MSEAILWRIVVTVLLSANLTLLGFLYRGALNRVNKLEVTMRLFIEGVISLTAALHPDKADVIMTHMKEVLRAGGHNG
jgi:hypothetical protein